MTQNHPRLQANTESDSTNQIQIQSPPVEDASMLTCDDRALLVQLVHQLPYLQFWYLNYQLVHRQAIDVDTYGCALPPQGVAKGTAGEFLDGFIAELEPRSPIERMLAVQMAWQHGRIACLVRIAGREGDLDRLHRLNLGIDAAMNTFRRQATAWQQLRAPRQTQFLTSRQVNIANQQVVNNAQDTDPETGELDERTRMGA